MLEGGSSNTPNNPKLYEYDFFSRIAKQKTRPADTDQGMRVNKQCTRRVLDYLIFFSIKHSLHQYQPISDRCAGAGGCSPDRWRAGEARFLVCIYLIPLCPSCSAEGHSLLHHQALQLLLFIVGTKGNMDPPSQHGHGGPEPSQTHWRGVSHP